MSKTLPVNMALVASGAIAAQAVNMIGFLIATRYLDPVDFGIFGIHMAISAPLAILATGRYEVGFINAQLQTKVVNLLVLSVSLALLSTLAAALILCGVFSETANALGLSATVICGLLLGQALVNCTTQLNNYNRSYRLIATSRVFGALAAQATVIALAAWAGAGHHALGIGMVLGMGFSICISLMGNSGWLRANLGAVSLARMRALACRNFSYLLFNGPQALASTMQESAAIAVITAFFGQSATGVYVFAHRFMRAPISIVAESVGRVLQRQFGDMARNDHMVRDRFLRKSILYLAAFALVFCTVVWCAARPVVTFIFSPEWTLLGDLVRASAPYYATYLVATTLASIPLATGDHKPLALMGIAGSAFYVLLLAVAGRTYTDNLVDAFVIVSAGMAVYFSTFVYAVYNFVIRRHAV